MFLYREASGIESRRREREKVIEKVREKDEKKNFLSEGQTK
jgi:hypothetical protein